MIHVLDCNSLIHLEAVRRHVRVEHECVVPDEIKEEFLTNLASEAWYRACVFSRHNLDEVDYLAEYARLLNSYGDVSFFNLKGFGDVAILATLSLLTRQLPKTSTLSASIFPQETICLVSNDANLRNFASREFPGLVNIKTCEDFAAGI